MKRHARTLVKLANRYGWKRGAELGVRRAETTVSLLANVPELFLYAVDTFAPTEGSKKRKNKETGFKYYNSTKVEKFEADSRAALAPYEGRFELMKMFTHEAAPLIEDLSLDFVFIDASHRTEDVIRDIDDWSPKVKLEGAIIGHDFSWPAIKKALKRFNLQPHEYPGDVWLHWK